MQQSVNDILIQKLKAENCFWSYAGGSIDNISDDMLIEKTLVYLDLSDINMLFKLFPYSKIKRVWLDELVPQGEYLYTLNRFLAWYYFDIKHPDQYLKSMMTRHLNRLS